MRCHGCGEEMAKHAHLPAWHCLTLGCPEFDRWHAVTEKLVDRVAPERACSSHALPLAPIQELPGSKG